MDFTYSDIDVSGMFNRLEQVFCDKTKPGVKLICVLPEKGCFIHSEKNRLMQVVTNFLTNACKFTFEGSITMGYEETEGGLRFYVADTGKGIAGGKHPACVRTVCQIRSFHPRNRTRPVYLPYDR